MSPFVINQQIVISNSHDHILLLERIEDQQWILPGGRLHQGEASTSSIFRVVESVTQLTVDNPRPFHVGTTPDHMIVIAYKGKLRGGRTMLDKTQYSKHRWLAKKEALSLDLPPEVRESLEYWTANDQPPSSSIDDVLALIAAAEEMEITLWLDGGWGVDALLQEQTRHHDDIDIVIQQKDVLALRTYLEGTGYSEIIRDDSCAWNFVLGDDEGHIVDFHVIVLDKGGNGIYGPIENGDLYPAQALGGKGQVSGRAVKCLTAEYQITSHTGYKLREYDYHDVSSICEKFGLQLPDEYRDFQVG